ncbi:hypothetical protein KJ742_04755 [Patescibacteria group bacterium]|nr:hypothetical protein [Patescibacteria group bacterium]MBU1683229.1 hypothetical protein [Patescibacteria group bacterium]MBU1935744.1 hypothetical protein [Patescibacteria group bacterium]
MNKPSETSFALDYDRPLSYSDDDGKRNIDLIAEAADGLYAHADEVHSNLLPRGASFANHSHAPKDGDRPSLWALERQLKAYNHERMNTVVGVRLRLNDYVKMLGLGIVSVSIELTDQEGNAVLPDDDFKPLTLGNVLSPTRLRQQILALFPIDQGNAEQINGDGKIHARTFAYGENIADDVVQEPDRLTGGKGAVIVTEGSRIGVSVPILNPALFESTRIAFQRVLTDRMSGPSQIYTCRNLKTEAALRMMREG